MQYKSILRVMGQDNCNSQINYEKPRMDFLPGPVVSFPVFGMPSSLIPTPEKHTGPECPCPPSLHPCRFADLARWMFKPGT